MMTTPGFGPPDARIIFLGETPGDFMDSSGKFLNALLMQTGINRHECYFTTVIKQPTPHHDFGVFYNDKKKTSPSQMLLDAYRDLHSELRGLRPSVIVPLGSEALRAITGKISIDKWRGSIIPSSFGKIISTYNPTYLMRDYASTPVAVHDLERIREESGWTEVRDLGHVLEINPSYSRAIEFLSSLLEKPRPISFDIETTRPHTHVRSLAIADSNTHAVCIPFMSYQRPLASKTSIFIGLANAPTVNSHWTEEEEYEILSLLDKVFSSSEIPKIAQNFPFDASVLGREFGFEFHSLSLDTLIAAHTMYPEMPKGLDFLASLYTKVPYYSDYDPSVDEELWRYNCLDACVTYEIASILEKDLRERSLGASGFTSSTVQHNHIQPAMSCYTRIGQRGVLCDLAIRDQLKLDYSQQMESYRLKLSGIAGIDLNPASNKQMGEYLYGKLGLPIQRNRKTGEQTVDENAINSLSAKHPQHAEFFSNLLEWRERQKLISTYLEIPLTLDNRLTTSFNCVGTVNGRCNSSKTLWGTGTNLQNIPKRSALGRPLRRMFIADPGYTIIKADLSQAQFRAVCWLGKMQRLMDRYLQNPKFDVHKWVASLIYRVEEVQVIDDQRNIAKNGVYGGTFHMMPKTAAVTYKIPLAEATFVLNAFWKALPEIPLWWKQVEHAINTTRTLVSPHGRVRSFMGRIDDSLYRDAYAFCPQAIEADIIHRAIILSESLLLHAEAVLQIHDEIVFSCRTEHLGDTLPLIKTIMEQPIFFEGVKEPLIIPSDVSYGPNWLDQTKWKG